ncbi:hypothetical protein Ptr902_10464 [Pyrenophora tritici-repentis]|nr:hypothetical protein L13192_10099 [Pyrenophora tritici-repentis]KAI2478269.1 hypothetical protein Ptr902_10464 [Pyrenophora tritici-repentis]
MSDPIPTEKLVYLALKDVFVGNEIQPSITKKIRKKVRKRIEKVQDNVEIKALIQQHTLEHIITVAIVLLEEQIFNSDAKAKARFPDVFKVFPDVFKVLPSQDDEPTDSRPKIEEGDAATVQRTRVYSPEELLSIGTSLENRNEEEQQIKANLPAYIPKIATSEVAVLEIIKGKELETNKEDLKNLPAVSESSQQPHTQPRTATRSLDSVRLPLWDQHRTLVKVQYALEKACFTFAQKHLGDVLQREGWDCAEAVELNRWPKVLLTYQEKCDLNIMNDSDKSLPIFLNSIIQLRHDTVHRVHLSSTKILQYLADAVLLARLLYDDVCAESMYVIREMTQNAIEQMMRSKQLLDLKLANIKKEFAAKRAELERRESTLLEATMREHNEPIVSVSGRLEQRLSGDLGGFDQVRTGWGHAHDSSLSSNECYEPRSTVQFQKGQESGDETVAKSDESKKDVEQISVSPILVPTVDGGFIELALTREKKDAGKDKYEHLAGRTAQIIYPDPIHETMPTVYNHTQMTQHDTMTHEASVHTIPELDSRESEPKHSPRYFLRHHRNVSMATKNAAEEDEDEIEAAAVMSD